MRKYKYLASFQIVGGEVLFWLDYTHSFYLKDDSSDERWLKESSPGWYRVGLTEEEADEIEAAKV